MLSMKRASDGEASVIKCSTLAAVAWSVHELYNEAAAAFATPTLAKHIQREWGECSRVKAIMYQAEAHYMQVRLCCFHPLTLAIYIVLRLLTTRGGAGEAVRVGPDITGAAVRAPGACSRSAQGRPHGPAPVSYTHLTLPTTPYV